MQLSDDSIIVNSRDTARARRRHFFSHLRPFPALLPAPQLTSCRSATLRNWFNMSSTDDSSLPEIVEDTQPTDLAVDVLRWVERSQRGLHDKLDQLASRLTQVVHTQQATTQPSLKGLLECSLRSHLRLDEKLDGLITCFDQLGSRVNQLAQAQGAMDTRMADLHRALPLPKMYHVCARARQPSLPS